MKFCAFVSGKGLFWTLVVLASVTVLVLACWPSSGEVATKPKTNPSFQIGDVLVVEVDKTVFAEFDKSARAAKKDWGLALGGRYLPCGAGCEPAVEYVTTAEGTRAKVRFLLKRTAENREAWKALLESDFPRSRKFSVGVGTPDFSLSLPLEGVGVTWDPRGRVKSFFSALLTLVLLGASFCLAKGDLLRDPTPATTTSPGTGKRPLSLARAQLFFWTVNAFAAFLLIWALTGTSDTLTGSVLLLLGVSVGTRGISGAIDQSKVAQARALPAIKADLATQKQALTTAMTGVAAEGRATAAIASELDDVNRRIAQADIQTANNPNLAGAAPAGEDWWTDLVSDGKGPAVHRLQHVLWTLALGVVFWGHVFRYLAMPDFDSTLLGLMGLSSGGYLMLKNTEPAA